MRIGLAYNEKPAQASTEDPANTNDAFAEWDDPSTIAAVAQALGAFGTVIRLEADLTEAKDRADRAEQWVMLIRREIEDHVMPAMRDGPKPTNSAARPRLLTLPTPSRSRFRRLWLRVTSTAALGCRDLFDRAPQHEPGFFNGVRKTGNTASNIGQQVEIFIVLVFAAFSFAKHLLRLDELDTLDPFDHLVAKLVLYAQP